MAGSSLNAEAIPIDTKAPLRPGAQMPFVTIDILAYNRRAELETTLRKVAQLDYPIDRLEVVVVDNASTDGTAEMVRTRFPAVTLIENDANTGVSGWNHGFGVGRGDYVLVLDDDCYISGGALETAVRRAEESRAHLVSFRVLSSKVEDFTWNAHFNTGLLAFWGCSALISRRAISELGGFDDGIFVWAHEAEFTMRLLNRRLKHLYLPEVTSVHMKTPPTGFDALAYRTNMRNHAYIAAKLMQPRDAAAAILNLALRSLIEALIRPSTVPALGGVCAGALAGLRRRRPVRPEVSATYRRNFVEFVSPLRFVRGPLTRWQERGGFESAEADLRRRRERFWRERSELYPSGTAELTI